jgi:hypothetical protein
MKPGYSKAHRKQQVQQMAKQHYFLRHHLRTFVAGAVLAIALVSITFSAPPNFTRITTGPHVNDGGSSFGVSWIDYDNDGWLDLYVGNAGVENNCLYHSEGDGTFTKVTASPLANDGSRSYSHAWGDYDNDGDEDVYVGRHNNSTNLFFANNGDGTFSQITTAGDHTTDPACSNTHAWIDIDNDGDLDLYSQTETNGVPWSDENAMYRNDDGFFVKITTGAIVNEVDNAHGMSWSDYDNDGDMDLFVANAMFDYPLPNPADYMYRNCYYRNDGDFNFTKIVSGPLVTDLSISFGPSLGDHDNDGDQDLFVANGAMDLVNFLYNNNGDGSFTRVTTGVMLTEATSTLGSSWADYDNDGDLDLYVTTWGDNLPNRLYENNGDGTYTQVLTGTLVTTAACYFGPAWGDYDRDGDLDLFITKYQSNNVLYRNDGNGNNWLNVKCVGTVSNASAIGAKVRVKATIDGEPVWQLREISPAAGYCVHHAISAHFGLGDATEVDSIQIEWPSGLVDVMEAVAPNQFMTMVEACCEDRVGDANGSGEDTPTIGDISVMIDAKFISSSCDGLIACLDEADINQSAAGTATCDDITIGDISYLIDYLFITGSSLGLPECL